MRIKSKLGLILVCFLAFQTLIMTESKAGNILQQGAHEEFTITDYRDTYTLTKWIGWPWLITSANIDAGCLWIMTYNIDQKNVTEMPCRIVSATGIRLAGEDSVELFTAKLHGTYWAGGEGGGTSTYSITATFLETLAVTNAEQIVPLNGTAVFTLYNFGSRRCGSYWRIPPSATWLPSHPSFFPPTNVAGEFWIEAAPHSDGGDAISIPEADTAKLMVVEVASLLATYGTAPNATTASSTTNDPKISETLIIPKGKSATIVATPNPDVWPTYMAGDPPTAHSYPTWSVTGSSTPATILTSLNGPSTSIKSTVGSGTYKIVASCGTSTKAINITVIQIAHNNTDVTDASGTSKTMIIGEPNNLVVSGATFSSVSWTIPGSHIKSWTVHPTTTLQIRLDLTTTDLSTASLPTYYWYKSGTDLTPSVTVTIGSEDDGFKSATIKTKPFTVIKPNISVSTTTGTIGLDQARIYYGDRYAIPGIKLSHPLLSSPTLGITMWIQLYTGLRRRQIDATHWERSTGPGLDPGPAGYWYDTDRNTADSPFVALPASYLKAIVSDSFKMYLMYKPLGGIYVPLKVTSWGWNGTATKSGTIWSLSGDTKEPTSTSDASDYPNWTKVMNPAQWTPE